MNLRTRRLGEAELLAWAGAPGHEVWAVTSPTSSATRASRASSASSARGHCTVVDYVLSCRVMGRRVEETLVWFATERARAHGVNGLIAPYVPTAKNTPCRVFFESLAGFRRQGDAFVCDITGVERPRGVDVVVEGP